MKNESAVALKAKSNPIKSAQRLAASCCEILAKQLEVTNIENTLAVSVSIDGMCVRLALDWNEDDETEDDDEDESDD